MPGRVPPRTQPSLELDPRPPAAPVAVPEEAVPALADLLLAALGRDRRVPAGGGDDQQDHR